MYPEPETTIETLAILLTTYTGYNLVEANNLLSGVISPTQEQLKDDVVDWCMHIKEVENALMKIKLVASGEAVVRKQDGKWVFAGNASQEEVQQNQNG